MFPGTSNLLNSISRLNPRLDRNLPSPNLVTMRLERQKPPIKQTSRQFKELQNTWLKGQPLDRNLFSMKKWVRTF